MGEALDMLGLDIGAAVGAIRQSSLFCHVPEGALRKLVTAMHPHRVKQGDVLLTEGDRAREFLVLMQGHAVVERKVNGEARTIGEIGRPTLVGEESLVGERAFGTTVRMKTDGIAFRLSRTGFGEFAGLWLVPGINPLAAADALQAGARLVEIVSRQDAASGVRSDLRTSLSGLRAFANGLSRDIRYVCCGARAYKRALAAFLLRQWGCDAVYVKGSLLVAGRHLRGCRTTTPSGE
jgi:CRP-like cAMP-binding protein